MVESDEVFLRFVPLAEEYLNGIMTIEIEAYPEPWTEGMFREEMRSRRSHFLVAMRGGELAGYGGYWLVDDEAHITSVTIRNSLRGRGYGRLLTCRLLDDARQAGARTAILEVRPRNLVAQNLYQSLGFRAVGVRKGYYVKSKEDAIVMKATLMHEQGTESRD